MRDGKERTGRIVSEIGESAYVCMSAAPIGAYDLSGKEEITKKIGQPNKQKREES